MYSHKSPAPSCRKCLLFLEKLSFPRLFLSVILAVPAGWWGKGCGVDRKWEAGGPVPAAADGGQDPCSGQDCPLPEGT